MPLEAFFFHFLLLCQEPLVTNSLWSLLFLFITLLYKSFKSDVAKRPPSSGTRGLNSGGITGITLRIIHSGFNFESINASTSFNLLTSFLILVSELVDSKSSLTFFAQHEGQPQIKASEWPLLRSYFGNYHHIPVVVQYFHHLKEFEIFLMI